jgi:hypothetical protein
MHFSNIVKSSSDKGILEPNQMSKESRLAMLLLCVSPVGHVPAQVQSAIADLNVQRTVVVRMRSTPEDRAAQTFTGLYVGRDQQNAYFVTALHPLSKASGPNAPANQLQRPKYNSQMDRLMSPHMS